MDNIKIKFVGIDTWNRPIFKDINNNFYGTMDKLFNYNATKETVINWFKENTSFNLFYFGNHFDCEPMGALVNNLKIVDNL